jgi:cation transport regulator ChaC
MSGAVELKYFAYGSNMWTPRLRERVPSCEFVTAAKLHGYQLRFHKRSSDNSSKCNAFYTGVETDIIWGTVFIISVVEKRSLDKAEGLGHGYNEKTVDLITTSGEHLKAITYYAERTAIAEGLAPYTWYKDLVLNGAAEHGLPTDYVALSIEAVTPTKDPDASRDKTNRFN